MLNVLNQKDVRVSRKVSTSHTNTCELSGSGLCTVDLAALAAGGRVSIAGRALERMRAARAVIDDAVTHGKPVYGVTTGLGSNVGSVLSEAELSTFSQQTLRGRAQAIGIPLDYRIVRAAMIVRLNTLLSGAAGASLDVARVLRECINKNVTPVIGESASIGASDLIWGATMGLALTGEGTLRAPNGDCGKAVDVLHSANIQPVRLGPRDGLALASHSSFAAAIGALGVADAANAIQNAQQAAALSMQGFAANVSPLRQDVLALCKRPGEQEAADGLRALLSGSSCDDEANARRLQDPLSIRNIVQIHGAVFSALAFARDAAGADINGAGDNPVVLVEKNAVVSGGAYHTTGLAIAVETLSRALAHLATAQQARIAKLMSSRFSDLPQYLAAPGSDSNGFAPLMKPAEALVAEIIHLANPAPIWPSLCADGVEDSMTSAPLAGKSLLQITDKLQRLNAIELIVAAQAVELRGEGRLGEPLQRVLSAARRTVSPLDNDRSMIGDIERLANVIRNNKWEM